MTFQTRLPRAVGIKEAAAALSVSTDSLRRLIKRGTLRSSRIGKRVVIPITELDRLLGGTQETTTSDV
jgi:excisionase family DNA binding protein